MEDYERVISIIKKYFPENLKYESYEYQNSKQFMLYKKKRRQYKRNSVYNNYIEKKVKGIFKGYAFRNYIDWDDYKCIEFKINMHKNWPLLDDDFELIKALGGKRRELYISISILANYYYYYFGETCYDFNKENIFEGWHFYDDSEPNSEEEKELLIKLDNILMKEGYKKLDKKLANLVIEDIETEFVELGKVKTFDCLFTDFTIFFS
ncbi:hypothetical protein [Terrisporobacter mayombei]|uniref:Uncharacterized protein n=1 Tax=Terrisporobacter mayombei TaxID=1541 RepID=A0ABY9Q5K2_9FIRM|nr:hypothetical protein [Terrisporobacter mayombei]MCC3868993.1 hypothetical protein [Terrisporobacter mayombei]WMT82874.1 hypothetical protein TEMA_33700 [Terrisporobacter mayombei]